MVPDLLWTLQATVSHIHPIISGVLSHCASAIPCGHLVLYLWSLDVYSVCVKNPECVTAELLQGKRYVHLTSLAVLTTFRLFIYLLFWGVFSMHLPVSSCALTIHNNVYLGSAFQRQAKALENKPLSREQGSRRCLQAYICSVWLSGVTYGYCCWCCTTDRVVSHTSVNSPVDFSRHAASTGSV